MAMYELSCWKCHAVALLQRIGLLCPSPKRRHKVANCLPAARSLANLEAEHDQNYEAMDTESRSPGPRWRWLAISVRGTAASFEIVTTGQRTAAWHGDAPISCVGLGKLVLAAGDSLGSVHLLRVRAPDPKHHSARGLKRRGKQPQRVARDAWVTVHSSAPTNSRVHEDEVS
jgi:hypothetical protein